MNEYVRPAVEQRVLTDGSGTVIPYGRRWEGSPPDGTYSVTAHPERFAPLHAVAHALIAHLVATYDATAEDDPAAAAREGAAIGREARAVTVLPASPDASPLTFVLTGFPGVLLRAGALTQDAFPHCGCDACDDDVVRLVEDLEGFVLGVVAGGLSESVTDGEELRIGSRLVLADGAGESSGWTPAEPEQLVRLEERGVRAPWSCDWAEWPRRG